MLGFAKKYDGGCGQIILIGLIAKNIKGVKALRGKRDQILVHLNAEWRHLMPLACQAFNLE